jgi:radical SAM superfamily enzyme YgiQ (UPF0313 family)
MAVNIEQMLRSGGDVPPTRVDLINPGSQFLDDDRTFASLGLLYGGAALREAGHEVYVHDLAGDPDYRTTALNIAKGQSGGVYGVTATSPQYHHATQILEAIKSGDPESYTVIGGSHATMFSNLRNERYLQLNSDMKAVYDSDPNFRSLEVFDTVMKGEESAFFLMLNAYHNPAMREQWMDGGVTENLEGLPNPARELVDFNSYLVDRDGKAKFDIGQGATASAISQRGCPFKCLFCGSGADDDQYGRLKTPGGNFRARSPESVVAEFNEINDKYGAESFMLYDDELNVNPRRFGALLDALSQNNDEREQNGQNAYMLRGFVKGELFLRGGDVQAQAMKRAGFSQLLSGFESGDEYILANSVRKNTTVKGNLETIDLAHRNGLGVKFLTMVGHPEETYDSMKNTEDFIREGLRRSRSAGMKDTFDITALTPIVGSPIYNGMRPNDTGNFENEFPLVFRGVAGAENEGKPILYMKSVDYSDYGAGAYKTAEGEDAVITRTPELTGRDIIRVRREMDKRLREEFDIPRLMTAVDDTEHSMGQTTSPGVHGS